MRPRAALARDRRPAHDRPRVAIDGPYDFTFNQGAGFSARGSLLVLAATAGLLVLSLLFVAVVWRRMRQRDRA